MTENWSILHPEKIYELFLANNTISEKELFTEIYKLVDSVKGRFVFLQPLGIVLSKSEYRDLIPGLEEDLSQNLRRIIERIRGEFEANGQKLCYHLDSIQYATRESLMLRTTGWKPTNTGQVMKFTNSDKQRKVGRKDEHKVKQAKSHRTYYLPDEIGIVAERLYVNSDRRIVSIGEDLSDLSTLKERFGTLSLREALSYLLDVLKGLEHLHSRGLIHGDVKEDNVFITDQCDSVKGRAALFDFESVRFTGDESFDLITLTHSEREYYISKVVKVEPAYDMFSFGILLFQVYRIVHMGEEESLSSFFFRYEEDSILKSFKNFFNDYPDTDRVPQLEKIILNLCQEDSSGRHTAHTTYDLIESIL